MLFFETTKFLDEKNTRIVFLIKKTAGAGHFFE
jgi:hypothetical protein